MKEYRKERNRLFGDADVEQETQFRRQRAQILANLRGVKVENLKEKTHQEVEEALGKLGIRRHRPYGQ